MLKLEQQTRIREPFPFSSELEKLVLDLLRKASRKNQDIIFKFFAKIPRNIGRNKLTVVHLFVLIETEPSVFEKYHQDVLLKSQEYKKRTAKFPFLNGQILQGQILALFGIGYAEGAILSGLAQEIVSEIRKEKGIIEVK